MAEYDIVDTVVGVICDSVDIDPFTGKATIINPSSAVSVGIVSWPNSRPDDFDFNNVASPLSSLIPNSKTIVFGTAPNVDISNPTDIAWVSTRVNSEYPNDISNYGAKDASDNVARISNAQIAFPFTLVRSAGGYTLLLMRRPEWSPTTFNEYSWSNLGGKNNVPAVRELYPLAGGEPEFNLSSPELPLYMSRGQSTELSFSLTVNGVTTDNVQFTYDDTQPDAYGVTKWRISGSTLTITNECWAQELFIYFHPVEYPELEYVLTVSVTDPVNPPSPYNPPGGGTGGSGIPTGPGGGGGTFPSGPGPSMLENIPTGQTGNDLANSGLFTMYLMNQQYMNLIGDIMWEDNLGIQALKAVFGQPIDAIISTMSYPFDLTNFVTKTAQNLFFGPWNSGLPFQALTKSSFQIDWGIITIPFGWGNFLDYAPHTKMELFLPWGPGYVPIDPNDVSPFSNTPGNFNVGTFTNGSIQVKTNIELGKGTCVHNVIGNNGKVIGSYSGIVGKQVPMTALDSGGKLLTTIGAVATMTAGAATAAGAMSGKFNTGQTTPHKQVDPLLNRPMFGDVGYMQKASEAVSTVNRGANMAASALLSNPISFPRAGTFSDGSSAMTVQQPFLLISRPVQSVPSQYGHYNGYPSNIYYANLSGLSGYTEISEIHLDNVTATADELAELDSILKGGILL